MIDTNQLIEWFDSQAKRIDRLLEEKSYYLYHANPELYERQLKEQKYYYGMTILLLSLLANNEKHYPKIEAWEVVKKCLCIDTDSWDEYSDSFDYIRFTVASIHPLLGFSRQEIESIKKALEVEDE